MEFGIAGDILSTPYRITFMLHILAVMAGLGLTYWYGVYGLQSKKAAMGGNPVGGAAIADANNFVSSKAKWVIYSIPLWGIGLVFMSDDVWGFDQAWVWLSLVLFAVALVIATVVLEPSSKRIAELVNEMAAAPPPTGGPPPQVADLDVLGKRLGMFSGINHLLLLVILYLMIWKPGL